MVVPRGEEFLASCSIENLTDLYDKENEPRAKIRLLSAIKRKEGGTLEEIGSDIKRPFTTVGDWLRRMHEEGVGGRYGVKQTGRPKRLTSGQMEELKSALSAPPSKSRLPFSMWTTKLAREYIEDKYGISYKPRQTRNLFHEMGFSCQKPRPVHRNASKKAQEAFKKSSKKWQGRSSGTDSRSCFWTRASSR